MMEIIKKLTVSLAALALLLTGCSSSGSTGTEAPTVERTHAAEESPEAKDSPKPEDKPEAKKKEPKKKPPKPKKTAAPSDAFAGPKVNAESYHIPVETYGSPGDHMYFFTTASGKHKCEIATHSVTCDSDVDGIPANAPLDSSPSDGSYHRASTVMVSSLDSPEPAFAYIPGDAPMLPPGATPKVLQYGEVLSVYDFKCTTDESKGVMCTNGKHGFEWSSQDHKLY